MKVGHELIATHKIPTGIDGGNMEAIFTGNEEMGFMEFLQVDFNYPEFFQKLLWRKSSQAVAI